MSRHLFLLLLLVAVGTGVLHQTTRRLELALDSPYPVSAAERYRPESAVIPAFSLDALPPDLDLDLAVPARLRRGETLGTVLQRHGLEPDEVQRAAAAAAAHIDLRRLRAGASYQAYYREAGGLGGLDLRVAGKGIFRLRRHPDRWVGEWLDFARRVVTRSTSGVLERSLEGAARAAGAPAAVAYEMADVLQWDLDFNRDLRRGDSFDVVYEELYLDGELFEVRSILALKYQNQGRSLEAYRYRDGYYDADGRPLRKQFLRSPLQYSRVTSSFSARRFHPILKAYRPHYGVDYGAPTGTPVRATAAGVVSSAGSTSGGGKTVSVRHANGYVTSYLHLSRFAAGLRAGRRVAQSEVVGYVGATGLATAPHLDYRVQQGGRWLNPAGLVNEPAPPIPEAERELFVASRDALREQLGRIAGDASGSTLVATATSPLEISGSAAGGR